MSDDEKGEGTDDDNYRISPRDFFVPTQVLCTYPSIFAQYSSQELYIQMKLLTIYAGKLVTASS